MFAVPGEYTFSVPTDVHSLNLQVWGGGGAGGSQVGSRGGGGAYADGTIAVTPGEELAIWVAEGGVANGNGGGASYVLRGDTRLIVAAGGGGGGSDGCSGCSAGGAGGAGGGATGETGAPLATFVPPYCTSASGGTGGTATTGGEGGTATGSAFACAGGIGGAELGGVARGVNNTCDVTGGAAAWRQGGGQGNGGGGGGGSGWFGGGGAGFIWTYCAGGGGGGSSYADGSVTGASFGAGDGQEQGNAAESTGAGLGGAQNADGAPGRVVLSW